MTIHYIMQLIFLVVGLLVVLASAFDWEWFFTARNTQFIVANAGRRCARLFYAALGLLLMATGVFFFLTVRGVI